MEKPKAKDERPESAREAAIKRRTFDMGEVLGMRHLRTVTVAPDMSEPEPGSTASDGRGELFERQEAEMRRVFGLPRDWRMDDLQPEKPKGGGK